jgi:GntR family transcriptional regulator
MKRAAGADERLPLYQRLRDDLTQQIASGTWKAGEAIPAEAELAATYAVSVGTVRKTVDALVAEGLLERFQGKGTFVRRPSFDSSLFRFFRFQRQSGERRVPQSRILKREVAEVPSAVATALEVPAGAEGIHLSRLRLLDDKPILAEDIWVPKAAFAPLLDLPPEDFGDLLYPLYEARCGKVVASAQETLTAEAVSAMQGRLLRLPAGAPVIVIERLAFGFDRRPLEWRRSRGPADQFQYHVEIR